MSDSFFRKTIQEKMGEGSAQPAGDLWDNLDGALAQKRAAIRKKNRFLLLWLLPIFLLVGGSLFHFMNEKSEDVTINEKIIAISETDKKDEVANQSQVAENQMIERSDEQSLEIKKPKSSTRQKAKKPILIKEENQFDNSQIEQQPQVFNSQITVTQQQLQKSNSATLQLCNNGNLATKQLEKLEALTAAPQFLKIQKTHPKNQTSKITEIEIEKDDTRKQNFSIGINYGINQLEYCFTDKANNETAQLKLGYRFHKYFSANAGLGFHNVNYDFEVNASEHIASFGDTDKYPSFYKLKNDVAQIESRLSYLTIPVALNFHLPITKQLTATLSANQDFAYNQDQLLIYSFKSGADDLEFRETNSKIQLGLTTFRLGLDYPIVDGLKAEVRFNRIITFQTLGIERQYYHGVGGDFGLRYDF